MVAIIGFDFISLDRDTNKSVEKIQKGYWLASLSFMTPSLIEVEALIR